ncbi:MAG: hypothetical protein HY735_17320 [Verrucomicrobia bacterium]|nr:hypothetical protein [Verrucomicrobiota bacterium]
MQRKSPNATLLFLIEAKLQPGDVVLTLGNEKFSERIGWVTHGKYSHAILVVSKNKWFEADDEGVGYSSAWTLGAWPKGPGVVFQHLLALPACSHAQLFRHPALKGRAPEDIEKAIATIVKPWEGEDYSDFRRLFRPLEISGERSWWVKLALSYHQRMERRRASGMFCSEVVARVFEELERDHGFAGASLFDVHRDADRVHPGHLANSRLRPVDGAVLDSQKLSPGVKVELSYPDLDRRLPARSARTFREAAEFSEWLEKTNARTNAETLESEKLRHSRIEHDIRRCIELTSKLNILKLETAFRALLDELKTINERTVRHFRSQSTNIAEFWHLSVEDAELEFRVENTKVDMIQEVSGVLKLPVDKEDMAEKCESLKTQHDTKLRALDEFRRKHGINP